jgi:hypothetical protein
MRGDYADESASSHVQDILVSHVVSEPTGRFGRDLRAAWRFWPPFVRLATRVHVLARSASIRSVALGLLCTFGLTDFLLRSFDLAGSLDRTALGGCQSLSVIACASRG